MTFSRAREVVRAAIADRAFPAAVVEVGAAGRVLWREAFGHLSYDPGVAPASEHTVFDLASLTKVIATAPLVMQQMERGRMSLDDPLARHLPSWRGADREHVTIRDVLAHCGGFTGYLPFYRDYSGRREFEQAIVALPLEYVPRTQSIYSDLGFMLLAFALEDLGGGPLAAQFDALRDAIGLAGRLRYNPPPAWRPDIAPTAQNQWRGRLLVGEVDDDNAWALGGAAGHAGLFGTAEAVGAYAQHLLRVVAGGTGAFRLDTILTFITRRDDVPGSSRALAWDTMLPSSSCGTRMSPRAFGHTGFTGTSLWIDPDRGVYIVFLTNRVHPTAANDAITSVRPALHDAVVDALSR